MRKLKYALSQVLSIIYLFLLKKLKTDHNAVLVNKSKTEINIGYYDLPASSLNDSFTAFTERVNMRTSSAIDKTDICIVDEEFKNKRVLTETFVWNSQLGSRLMWSTVCEKTLFYLDIENDNIITKEIDVVNGEIKTYPFQAFCLDLEDKGFYGLNYSRLFKSRPGYGYIKESLSSTLSNDGLLYYSISNRKGHVIATYEELFKLVDVSPKELVDIRLNHLQLNYDGSKLIFLLRYQKDEDDFSHMIILNTNDGVLSVLPFGPHISHACWMSNDKIVLWAKHSENKDPAFYLYNIEIDTATKLGINKDGHPFKIDENKFICDTYNNSARQRELFTYNLENHTKIHLGKFYTGIKYSGSSRCDLHPRINRKRDKFIIDVSYTGKRNIAYGEI
jgi:hypothetical protein|tara:strand:+ start:4367 stop:5539 length:1173 start_codon:yes stop_codon:yes gene_type:complete